MSEKQMKKMRPAAVKNIAKKVNKIKKSQTHPVQMVPSIGLNRGTNTFPGAYLPKDQDRDTEFMFKKRYLDSNPFQGGKKEYEVELQDHVTEQDVKYMKDKQAVMEGLLKKEYVYSIFNMDDPKQAWLAQQSGILTDINKAQEAYIDYKMGVEKRLALIRQKGISDLDAEDWDFLFKLESGVIEYDAMPVWEPKLHGYKDKKEKDARKRGLFNPKLAFNPKTYIGPYNTPNSTSGRRTTNDVMEMVFSKMPQKNPDELKHVLNMPAYYS